MHIDHFRSVEVVRLPAVGHASVVAWAAFGVSAVASYVIPATGALRNAAQANLGTLVGAMLFLVGALLLLPERTEDAEAQ